MWKKTKRYLLHYFYGLFTKSWQNSISAVDAFTGLAAGAAVSTEIHAINWKGAVAVFAVTWVRSCLQYFKENPFPSLGDGAAKPEELNKTP